MTVVTFGFLRVKGGVDTAIARLYRACRGERFEGGCERKRGYGQRDGCCTMPILLQSDDFEFMRERRCPRSDLIGVWVRFRIGSSLGGFKSHLSVCPGRHPGFASLIPDLPTTAVDSALLEILGWLGCAEKLALY